MFDDLKQERERLYTTKKLVDSLPKLTTNEIEGGNQRNDLETILDPLLESIPDDVKMNILRIDVIAPENIYSSIEQKAQKDSKAIDPMDNSVVYQSDSGRIALKQISNKRYSNCGYTFHVFACSENFAMAKYYLSYIYSMDAIYSLLGHRGLTHMEERDEKNNIISHTFAGKNIKHSVILHTTDDFLQLEPIVIKKTEIFPTKDQKAPSTNLENIDFNDFPLTQKDLRDSLDPKEAFETFIKETTSILRLENFEIKYKNRTIYKNGDIQQSKIYENEYDKNLKIYFTGMENYPGIDIFCGLLKARFKYPIEIEFTEVVAASSDNKTLLKNELKLKQTEEQIKNFNLRYTFTNDNNIQVILRTEEPKHGKSRGRLVWNIKIPIENTSEIFEIIREVSKPDFGQLDFYGFHIKKARSGQHSHQVIARTVQEV